MVDRPECYICTQHKGMTDEHHVIPVEYGGPENGKTVPLCPSCHRSVHRTAEKFSNNEIVQAPKHLLSLDPKEFSLPEILSRFELIWRYIVGAKRRHLSTGKSVADTARNMVQLSLSGEERQMLHYIKAGMNLSSIDKTLRRLISDEFQRQIARKRERK